MPNQRATTVPTKKTVVATGQRNGFWNFLTFSKKGTVNNPAGNISKGVANGSAGSPIIDVNIAYSGVYQWWYTIGLRTNEDLYTGALFLLFLSVISLLAGWLHLQPKWKPSVSWFKNAESRLNHHLSGLFGVSSLAWTGHLVHVAIPGARGEYVRWNNFLDVLPHPQGLGPLFTGQWNLYAQNPDSSSHLFGTSQGAGTAILTLLGGFHPQTQSLWLTDIAHHHLAIAFIGLR
ncbi:hypothetical protein RDABS01_017689 [Bienertia sinuspersici]